MMKRLVHFVLAVGLANGPFAAGLAQPGADVGLVGLRALDRRVATIGDRLARTNLAWCGDRAWLAGFVLHDLAQYGPDQRAFAARQFGLANGVGVLAVADGSAAERAGIRPDDLIDSVDGDPLPRETPSAAASFANMERILEQLDRAFADGRATISARRQGRPLTLQLVADRGCATRFQLIPSPRLNAYADGRYVQITSAIADYVLNDDELAAIMAHEFAHNVLRHRARLDAAGVRRGLLANFGRNARLIRETEEEADRLGVWLLARAGYDPDAAPRFWRRFGRRGLNIFGSPTHGGWQNRVARLEGEIASMRAAGPNGHPTLLPAVDPR